MAPVRQTGGAGAGLTWLPLSAIELATGSETVFGRISKSF
jgi:hypothetical protein